MSYGVVARIKVLVECRHRRTFREAVALKCHDSKVSEKLQNLRVDCRAAGDEHIHVAAEHLEDILQKKLVKVDAHLGSYLVEFQNFLNRLFLALLADVLPNRLVKHFENQRNAEEEGRFNFLQVFLDIFQSFAVTDARSLIHRHQESAGTFVCVVQRQHAEESISFVCIKKRRRTHEVAADIGLRKHNALGNSRRS